MIKETITFQGDVIYIVTLNGHPLTFVNDVATVNLKEDTSYAIHWFVTGGNIGKQYTLSFSNPKLDFPVTMNGFTSSGLFTLTIDTSTKAKAPKIARNKGANKSKKEV